MLSFDTVDGISTVMFLSCGCSNVLLMEIQTAMILSDLARDSALLSVPVLLCETVFEVYYSAVYKCCLVQSVLKRVINHR